MNFDYTLYLVTDRQLMSCDSLTEAVEQAILGGCTMIQLREKELSSLEFYNQAVAVKQVTDKYHIPLIINDRIDIAMAVQATGVHIGQHDLPAAAVRKVIGENMLLGVSASSIAEAIQAQQMVQIIWELAQCSLLELKPTLILYQWRNYRKSAQPFLCRSLLLAVSIKEIQGVSSPWELTGWLLYLPS